MSAVRGQVWEYVAGSHLYRVLIVSSDEYNQQPDAVPVGLLLVPAAPGAAGGYAVAVDQADPVGHGLVSASHFMRLQPHGLTRPVGYLSHATYLRVEEALRAFLELP